MTLSGAGPVDLQGEVGAFPAALEAVMFDLDGTLIDSSEAHYRAYRAAFAEHGVVLEPDAYHSVFGLRADDAIAGMAARSGAVVPADVVHARKAEEFRSIVRTRGVRVLPLAALLEPLAAWVPLALVTSASRPTVDVVLEALSWSSRFAVIVTGEDVERSKPAPECYELAAQRLRTPPGRCLAFEDSEAGVVAATRAGMRIVRVGRAVESTS